MTTTFFRCRGNRGNAVFRISFRFDIRFEGRANLKIRLNIMRNTFEYDIILHLQHGVACRFTQNELFAILEETEEDLPDTEELSAITQEYFEQPFFRAQLLIYMCIMVMAMGWQLRNMKEWTEGRGWPSSLEYLPMVQLVKLFLNITPLMGALILSQLTEFKLSEKSFVRFVLVFDILAWLTDEMLSTVMILYMLMWLDKGRRKIYQFILFTIAYGYPFDGIISMLLIYNNVIFLMFLTCDTYLLTIPTGLRPNLYHRQMYHNCFGRDIIEYGVTIQVSPDGRLVGMRSMNILGVFFQMPEVLLPPVTAG